MTRAELVAELTATVGLRHEARFIVEDALGDAAAGQGTLDPVAIERAREWAARRQAGEPLQYVLGHWSFRTLDLLVDPRVLIPRPETEQVVEVALAELSALAPTHPVVVDAGTGSGAIALSLVAEWAARHPAPRVWASDASADALQVARANAARNGVPDAAVTFVEGHWLDALPSDLRGTVTLVVSNPPYVSEDEWSALPDDVRREPRRALVARAASDGTPGLDDVETILTQALGWLHRPGVAVVELAPHQAEAAAALARGLGYGDVRVEADLAGRPRALVARVA